MYVSLQYHNHLQCNACFNACRIGLFASLVFCLSMFVNVCRLWPEGDKAQVCALCALRALFVVRRVFFGRCWSQCRRVLSIEHKILINILYIYLWLFVIIKYSRSWHLYAIFQNSKKIECATFLFSWIMVNVCDFLQSFCIVFSFLSRPFSHLSLNYLQSRFEMVLAKSSQRAVWLSWGRCLLAPIAPMQNPGCSNTWVYLYDFICIFKNWCI